MVDGLEEALAEIEASKAKKRKYNTEWMKERRKTWTDEEWAKHNARVSDHAKRNREKLSQKARERIAANKDKAIEQLGGCCADCKQIYHRQVYDFHHLDGSEKEGLVSAMLASSYKKAEQEITKCILLCANCHRLRHAVC